MFNGMSLQLSYELSLEPRMVVLMFNWKRKRKEKHEFKINSGLPKKKKKRKKRKDSGLVLHFPI